MKQRRQIVLWAAASWGSTTLLIWSSAWIMHHQETAFYFAFWLTDLVTMLPMIGVCLFNLCKNLQGPSS